MTIGRLGYNYENGRYGLLVCDLWENDGLHCGQTMEVMVDGNWIPTQIEMVWTETGNEWYLVGTPYKGNLEYVRVRI